jgi:hypothetical protein
MSREHPHKCIGTVRKTTHPYKAHEHMHICRKTQSQQKNGLSSGNQQARQNAGKAKAPAKQQTGRGKRSQAADTVSMNSFGVLDGLDKE